MSRGKKTRDNKTKQKAATVKDIFLNTRTSFCCRTKKRRMEKDCSATMSPKNDIYIQLNYTD